MDVMQDSVIIIQSQRVAGKAPNTRRSLQQRKLKVHDIDIDQIIFSPKEILTNYLDKCGS